MFEGDVLPRVLTDLVEEVGSDDSSDEERGMQKLCMLICFLCLVVIRINPIFVADLFMLTDY